MYLENRESLDIAGVGDMGPSAKINQRTASIYRAKSTIWNPLVDEVFLVFAVVEHLQKLILGHLQTLEGLLLLDDGVGERLQSLLVLFSDHLAAK